MVNQLLLLLPLLPSYHVIETFIFQAVEVKFTLSEFVTCYKRLMGLNLEGFSEFVNRTLEALISTSMMVHKTMTTDKRKFSHTNQVNRSLTLGSVANFLQKSTISGSY